MHLGDRGIFADHAAKDDEEELCAAAAQAEAAACDCGSDSRDAMTRGDDENEVSIVM